MAGVRGAIARGFQGQSRRLIEACVAGGIAGASIAFVNRKIKQTSEAGSRKSDKLPDLSALAEFDSMGPQDCKDFVRLVGMFLPSREHLALTVVYDLLRMISCCEAFMEPTQRFPEAVYYAFRLSCRVRDSLSELSLLFPYDSPANKRATELGQSLFDLQDMIYAEVKGYARLSMI